MAVKTITKTCPFCKKVYEQRSFNARGKEVTEEERRVYGTPMKICPHCKRLFIDKDVQELAICGTCKRDKQLINPGTRTLALMGIILGALLFFGGATVFGYVAAGVGVLCAAVDVGLYPSRMKRLERERQASEKRLSDPDYARALKRAGYPVPDRYLRPEDRTPEGDKSETPPEIEV